MVGVMSAGVEMRGVGCWRGDGGMERRGGDGRVSETRKKWSGRDI